VPLSLQYPTAAPTVEPTASPTASPTEEPTAVSRITQQYRCPPILTVLLGVVAVPDARAHGYADLGPDGGAHGCEFRHHFLLMLSSD
jgi:hypothetical protein